MFKLTWYKGNVAISKETHNNTGLSDVKFVHVLNTDDETSATYSCEVNDANANIFTSENVIVRQDKPYLTITIPGEKPPTLFIKINETKETAFQIHCMVSSFPRANVTFTRLGETLITTNDKRITIDPTENAGNVVSYTLTLKDVTYKDATEYFCRATNGKLVKKTKVGVIYLSGQECSNDFLASGKQIQCANKEKCIWKTLCETSEEICKLFRCERPDTPIDAKVVRCTHNSVEIAWTRDLKAKKYIINVFSSDGKSYVLDTVGSHIVENGLRSNHIYEFTVEASNDFAVSNGSPTLKCKTNRMEPPTRVLNPKINRHENDIVFKWDLPKDDGMTVDKMTSGMLQYDVKFCPQEEVGQDLECHSKTTNETSLSLPRDVKANSLYKFTVIPINNGGMRGEAHTTYQTIPSNNSSKLQILNSILLSSLFIAFCFLKDWM